MTQVVRLQNPKALASPEFQAFLKKSIQRGSMIGAEELTEGLLTRLADPNFGAFIGVDKGVFAGIVLISLPSGPWQKQPYVLHFYNRGPTDVRDGLVQATVDFVVQNGYTTFMGLNGADRSLPAWLKTFSKAGTGKVVAQLVEFTVG